MPISGAELRKQRRFTFFTSEEGQSPEASLREVLAVLRMAGSTGAAVGITEAQNMAESIGVLTAEHFGIEVAEAKRIIISELTTDREDGSNEVKDSESSAPGNP